MFNIGIANRNRNSWSVPMTQTLDIRIGSNASPFLPFNLKINFKKGEWLNSSVSSLSNWRGFPALWRGLNGTAVGSIIAIILCTHFIVWYFRCALSLRSMNPKNWWLEHFWPRSCTDAEAWLGRQTLYPRKTIVNEMDIHVVRFYCPYCEKSFTCEVALFWTKETYAFFSLDPLLCWVPSNKNKATHQTGAVLAFFVPGVHCRWIGLEIKNRVIFRGRKDDRVTCHSSCPFSSRWWVAGLSVGFFRQSDFDVTLNAHHQTDDFYIKPLRLLIETKHRGVGWKHWKS